MIENYQQQIGQLNKILGKANASLHDFTQVILLEFKQVESDDEPKSEQKKNAETTAIAEEKKRWLFF